jgi:hypothetical protein
MSKKLNETIGAVEYDGIINSACHADVVTVKLKAGQGVLKRGTIVSGEPGTELEALNKTLTVSTLPYILTEDTDATAATVATAYRTGHFNRNKLITADGYTLTAADEGLLRACGILLSDAIEA